MLFQGIITEFFYFHLDHICGAPGCKTVLVLDGNMKNARQVCMVKDIGELHFSNMTGSIVVGTYCYCYYFQYK